MLIDFVALSNANSITSERSPGCKATQTGAKRSAHSNWLRGVKALRKLLDVERFSHDDHPQTVLASFLLTI